MGVPAKPALFLPVKTITSSYTATASDGMIMANTSAGPITVTLPPVATVTGLVLIIHKHSTDANLVTVKPAAGETINGHPSVDGLTLEGCAWTLIADTTHWCTF